MLMAMPIVNWFGYSMTRLPAILLMLSLPITTGAELVDHPAPLWLAEGDHNRIYLLGSVHILRKSDHPLPSVIEAVYDDAEVLVMELDMDDIDAAAMQALVTQLGVIQDGSTLRELMGEDLYQQAADAALSLDIPLDMLDKTEPWLAAITIEQLALNRIGFNPAYGIEMHLSTKAIQDGKEIQAFESIEEQLDLLDGLSLDAQRSLLLQTLEEGNDIQEIMNGLIEAWRHGDVQYLEDNMLAEMEQYPELYGLIVVDRNRNWVDAISALLDDDVDYLVVVGALHLIGENGIPELLTRRGVRVSQMHQSSN